MPKVELPLIGGGTTSLDGTLGTPTAIYYWDGTCFDESDCSPLRLVDFLAARRGIDAIVVISQRYSGSPWVPGRIPQADASVRVATDPDGVASGLVAADMTYDMLLLLDPGGNLVAVYSAGFGKGSGGVLGRILDAFAAGEALPRHPGGQAEAQLP